MPNDERDDAWEGRARAFTGPLARRLLLGFLVVSLLPLAISNGFGYLRSTTIIEGLVERYLEGIARFQALHVSDQLGRHLLLLDRMAVSGPLAASRVPAGRGARYDFAELGAFLTSQLDAHPTFDALYLFGPDGTIRASAPLPPDELLLWMDPPLREPGERVDVVRSSRPPHAPSVRLAVPVASGSGGLLYLGGDVPVLGQSEFLHIPEHTAGSIETFIVDEAGLPVFVSHPHGVVDYGANLETPLTGEDEGITLTYDDRRGTQVIGTIVAVPGFPWRLLTEVPAADALHALRQLRALSVAVSGVLAALVLALALAMSARIVAPVRRLLAATRRLAAGDLGARVTIRDRDEIGELGTAFNDMAGELDASATRIEELHQREIERAGQLATVGELAAGVAHEIKNPIVGISGGIDLVMRHTREEKHIQPIVKEMKRQVARVEEAVRGLLAFARPTEPAFAPADLREIVDRAVTLVRPVAASAAVRVRVERGPSLPVQADPEMLRQCLVNLLVNGIDAAAAGGTVTISAQEVDAGVEVRVADTGSGIPDDQLDQIFKPFYTTKHRGTGLGLSITHSIITRHGGTIAATSDPDGKTVFVVRLPRSQADEAPATRSPGSDS